MPATTEICTLTLAPGTNISDPNSPAAAALKECNDTLARQPGFQKLWYGTALENPETLQLFIDWDSKAAHETFQAADSYPSFRSQLGKLHTGAPRVVHVDFQPEGGVAAALSAKVTQFATFYFDDAPPASAFEGAKTLITGLIDVEKVKASGWAYGTTHEVVEKDGVKGRANVLVMGWESVEAHAASHETPTLKENIHLLTTEDVKTYEQVHVPATAYQRG